ncbi:MAG TPA: twitching motility protein [Phycisphaerales bacterium]|nr:twitching motility protein [Phycisphaerales bacterium]HCD31264.1 twitching motility protein [Phycisphaerales bacterium]|tara:strand:- start:557 stop:1642 length:1086 start_codon:yes stop_codon:yes gene_type:complete
MTIRKQFESLLSTCVQQGASDMHLTSDQPVSFRVGGQLRPDGEHVYYAESIGAMIDDIMTARQQKEFTERWTVDLGYTAANGERFRVNCYREMGQPAMAVRHLNQNILSLNELGLPEQLRELAYLQSGLVLVTGVTGSGKSTTLAVLLDEINRHRNCHILTVEDPVEFVHRNHRSLVHHREVHTDVPSFADAVRAGLREDPDVIMVGEMRDLETMQTSIIAAETGHLVFSTLHTGQAVGAVERFIGHFSGHEQATARHRISMVLRAVFAQRLVAGANGRGLVAVVEMLRGTHGVAHLIRNSKTEQLHSMMESGAAEGMWTLDQELARLVKSNKITRQVAAEHCNNMESFERLVQVASGEER